MFQQQESTDTFFLLDSLSWCHLRGVDLFVVESIKNNNKNILHLLFTRRTWRIYKIEFLHTTSIKAGENEKKNMYYIKTELFL